MSLYTNQGIEDNASVPLAKHVNGLNIEGQWDTFYAVTDSSTNDTEYCFGLRIDPNKPPTIENLVRLQTRNSCLKNILNDQRIIVEDSALYETNDGESWVNSWKNVGEISHVYVKNSVNEHTLRKSDVQLNFVDGKYTYGKVSPEGLPSSHRLKISKQRKHNNSNQQSEDIENRSSDEGKNYNFYMIRSFLSYSCIKWYVYK